MSGWAIAFGVTGMVLSVLTALATGLRAFRRREQDAAKRPFLAGVEAVNEAQIALRLKDDRLAEADRRLAQAVSEVQTATARAGSLQQQIDELYTRMGRLMSRNTELEDQARLAKEREERDRGRIRELELRVDELTKQLGLGMGH